MITRLRDRLDDMPYPTQSITEAYGRGPQICHLSSVISLEPKARMNELAENCPTTAPAAILLVRALFSKLAKTLPRCTLRAESQDPAATFQTQK